MLNAIEKNKLDYLIKLKGHGTEDSITSTFLGPLEFIHAGESWRFWQDVFNVSGHDITWPSGVPEEVSVEFWPKRKICGGQWDCEPDALIKYLWPNREHRILLLEFKWKSRLSSPKKDQTTQLHEQWEDFLSDEEKRYSHHVLIAQETSEGRNAQRQKDVWDGRLLLLSWERIHSVLLALSQDRSAKNLSRWATLCATFLDRLDIRAFKGFIACRDALHEEDACLAIARAANADELFYRPIRGFENVAPLPVLHDQIRTPLFYNFK